MVEGRTTDGVPAGGRVIVAGMKLIPHPRATTLLLAIDLVGTALFAAEGASVAVNARLDLLGVLVIAIVTAVGGGILRDVLLGDTPPSSMRDWRYFGIALVAGAGVFLVHSATHFENLALITVLDAAGLSFFAVAVQFRNTIEMKLPTYNTRVKLPAANKETLFDG